MSPLQIPSSRRGCHHLPRPFTRGFSLIELMLSILLVAIIIALLLPAMQKVNDLTRQARCLGNMRAYGAAILSFAVENGGLPRHPEPAARFDLWAAKYLNPVPRCPLMGDSKKGFCYTGNSSVAHHYPQLMGFPVPSSRIVLAAERNYASLFNDSSHLTMTIMGSGAENDDATPYPAKPQYHGTPEARGLHFFFIDGHVELVKAVDNSFATEPVFGPLSTGAARKRVEEGVAPGYFYDQRHFSRMRAGTLTSD